MARILFVTHDFVSHEPLGLEYISASLRRASHYTKACTESTALKTVREWQPDFVAFQVITGDQERWSRVAKNIQRHFPIIKSIFGGPHFFYNKDAQDRGNFVIRGEAESAILEVVERGQIQKAAVISDLDSLAFPDRDLFYNDDFPGIRENVIRNVMSCRGCPYKCTYCYNSNKEWQQLTIGQKIRYHSPEYVCEQIRKTFMEHGGKLVSFQDDIFGIDLNWLEKFSSRYQSLKIPFFAQLRPHLITEDRIKLLKRAGIHIASFAIESGNEQTRAEILDRHESNALILKGVQILKKHGVKFRVQNLLGLPVDEPLRDALETLRFNVKLRPALSWSSLLQAYPGTEVANYIVKKGLVKSVSELDPLVNATFFESSSIPIRQRKPIERLHKYWSAIVRWPWLYPFARILIHFNLGKRLHRQIFEKTKGYINAKEYWRVDRQEKHITLVNASQRLDRLGGELFP